MQEHPIDIRHRRVHRVRAIVLGVLRFSALVMITVGLIMVINRVVFGLWGTGNLAQGWSNWMGIGQWHGIFFGVPLTVAGIVIALASAWLSRWIVHAPPMGCASCGYASLDDAGRCSECGFG